MCFEHPVGPSARGTRCAEIEGKDTRETAADEVDDNDRSRELLKKTRLSGLVTTIHQPAELGRNKRVETGFCAVVVVVREHLERFCIGANGPSLRVRVREQNKKTKTRHLFLSSFFFILALRADVVHVSSVMLLILFLRELARSLCV